MAVASTAVTVLLAALLAFAAVRKLSHKPEIVQTYLRVSVPEDKLNYLAFILLAGAAGLLLGLLWAPLGIAAAIGVICYFACAIAFHIRYHDTRNLPTPITFAAIAVATLVLQFTRL
jgi:hypothetical protein